MNFSLYTNMLLMQKLWNSFRNKLMTAVFQRNGLNAIPAPSWGDLQNIELYHPQKTRIPTFQSLMSLSLLLMLL